MSSQSAADLDRVGQQGGDRRLVGHQDAEVAGMRGDERAGR